MVGKVTSGEADAGLIYASDAVAAGDQLATINAIAPLSLLCQYRSQCEKRDLGIWLAKSMALLL